MRIAVCMYGQIRTGNYAYKNILNYFGDNLSSCDFFIHTWNDVNFHRSVQGIYLHHLPISQGDVDQFINIYKPKKFLIESQQEFRTYLGKEYGDAKTGELVFQYHSYYHSNRLKQLYELENNFTYDIVIKLRPDIIFPIDRKFKDDVNDYLANPSEMLIDWCIESIQISNSIQSNISAEFYDKFKFNYFYGVHNLVMEKFYKWMSENNINLKIMPDYRLAFFRNTETFYDPLRHFDIIRYLGSLQYSQLFEHLARHWMWYYNKKDPNWNEKMVYVLKNTLDETSFEILNKNFSYHSLPEYFTGF
jgi:hypothetical protein